MQKKFKKYIWCGIEKKAPNFQPCKENARGNTCLETQERPIEHNKEH